MVWIILVAGALLSMLVPLFIGAQNFFVQALMSILFSAFIMLHLLAIVHLAHPFTGDIAVTASMYVDFIEETQRLGSTPLNP
jgi:FtsH-binding integral membrane protein